MSENAKPQAPRPRFGSVVDRETSRLTQLLVDSHTQILRGLSLLAPRERRSRIRWILAAGVIVVVGVLAADRPTREFLTSKGRDFYRARTASAAPSPAAASEPTAEPKALVAATAAVPTAVIASVASEPPAAAPAAPKEEAAPAIIPPPVTRSNRAPKTRGANRPRTASPQGGT